MSFARQVLHVLRKDVLRTRYVLAGYGALVAMATYGSISETPDAPRALGDFGMGSGWIVLLPILLVFVGMLVAAFAVQEDSVARADAFWLSQPLRSAAVGGAKLLFSALLLVPALIGQAFAFGALMHSFGLAELLPSASYYGAMLLAGMLLASRTRDLKTFAVAVVLFIVVANIAGFILEANAWLPAMTSRKSAMATVTVGWALGVAGLFWQYSRQPNALAGWLLSLGGATLLFLSSKVVDNSALAGRQSRLSRQSATPVQLAPTTTITVQFEEPDATDRNGNVVVRFRPSGLTPDSRLLLRLERAEVRSIGDSVVPERMNSGMVLGLTEFAVAAGTRWLFSGLAPSDSGRMQLAIDPRTRALAGGAVRTAFIDGRAREEQRRPVASLAVRVGERVETTDGRIEVSDLHVADSLIIVLATTAATFSSKEGEARTGATFSSSSEPRYGTAGIMYALVNEGRREAIRLSETAHGTTSEMLVLPGATVNRSYWRLTPAVPPWSLAEAHVDAAWVRGARLVIVEWVERTSYPVSFRAAVP